MGKNQKKSSNAGDRTKTQCKMRTRGVPHWNHVTNKKLAGGLSENCKAPSDWKVRERKISGKTERVRRTAPKENPRLLMRALLQMTIATDDITDRHNAPTVPSWRPEASAMAPSLLCSKYRTLLFLFFFFFLVLWKTTEEKVGHRHCFLLQCFPELDTLPADNNPRTCYKARNISATLKEKKQNRTTQT